MRGGGGLVHEYGSPTSTPKDCNPFVRDSRKGILIFVGNPQVASLAIIKQLKQ